MTEPLNQTCRECGKAITDSEYVVNWTSCADCFDRHYNEYLKEEERRARDDERG